MATSQRAGATLSSLLFSITMHLHDVNIIMLQITNGTNSAQFREKLDASSSAN